jgi:hypothetical protein
MKTASFSRRRFLRGLGTCIALPAFESFAAPTGIQGALGARPVRLGFVYLPNGVNVEQWQPSGKGSALKLSPTLQPLAVVKDHIQVLSGLRHEKAQANGDGGGDHARANATFLTGCQARKTAGADVQAGISVDQVAAEQLGHLTRLPSLELTCDKPRRAGSCDSGYSCSYQYNISWKSETTPMSPERNPREAFDRLFSNQIRGDVEANRGARDFYNKSILDYVQEDTKNLRRYLGRTDQGKLDDYLDTIREIEQRIEAAEKFAVQTPEMDRPRGVPDNYGEHLRLMYDLMAVAFQTDTTRISTFLPSHDGNNRSFQEIGVNEGHHSLSHHQNNKGKLEQIAKISEYYVEQFSYFLQKLRDTPDGEGTLLDNSMIVFGGGISDPNKHSHSDLPVILAGSGGGQLKPGTHSAYKDDPMCNLYVSMLNGMGVETDRFGDSTGSLRGI